MKKKILAVGIICLLATGITACSKEEKTPAIEGLETVSLVEETVSESLAPEIETEVVESVEMVENVEVPLESEEEISLIPYSIGETFLRRI